MRRVLIACTALSLMGVLSALLDHSLAHGALRASVQDGFRREIARLLAAWLPAREETAAAAVHAEPALKLGAMTPAAPQHVPVAAWREPAREPDAAPPEPDSSPEPDSPAELESPPELVAALEPDAASDAQPEPEAEALPMAEALQEINRALKADRMITEIAVPKLALPEAEPVGEGASAALFLLSPGLAEIAMAAVAPQGFAHQDVAGEQAEAAAETATETRTIASAPVTSASVALPPMRDLLIGSARAAAAKPAARHMPVAQPAPAAQPAPTVQTVSAPAAPPARYGWNELMRMAGAKGGDGEEPAKPFGVFSEKEFRARELRCMATAIYFEARGETVRGQIAVGQVIMNRVRSDFYPKTICGVVFQGQWNKNSCQFSFACDGETDAPKEREEWATALDVAKQVISGKAYLNDIADATHYHAVYVRPDWRREVRRIKQIGVHIFYKAPFVNPLTADPDYSAL